MSDIKYLAISSKNQITLNKDIRETLNVSSGDRVYFENTKYGLIMKKAEDINECPICEGIGTINNNECLFCNGVKIFNNKLDSKFIVSKFVSILIEKGIDVNIKKDDIYGYVLENINIAELSLYRDKCQLHILINKLNEYLKKEELLDISVIDKYTLLFNDEKYITLICKKVNEIQLEILKSILSKKETISEEEYNLYVNSFSSLYKDKISKFLIPFINI